MHLGGIRELCGEHQDSTVRLSISCSLLLKPKQTSEPAQRPISRGLEEARVLLSSKTLALQPSLSQLPIPEHVLAAYNAKVDTDDYDT